MFIKKELLEKAKKEGYSVKFVNGVKFDTIHKIEIKEKEIIIK